ncbi:MAG TPA: hypothetical protein VF787_23920 [Thermoanaerobaculia bacterium]
MVHVRAVPEGGSASERRNNPTNYEVTFHRTFYSRLLSEADTRFDARQPLPSLFASRWRDWYGTDDTTYFKIWREAPQGKVPCNKYPLNDVSYEEVVTADEEENLEGVAPPIFFPPYFDTLHLPSVSRVRMQDPEFIPRPPTGAVAGWVYFNLDADNKDAFATQNWVIVSMRAEKRYSIDMDSYALGNGCTPPQRRSEVSSGTGADIAPAPNVNP